MLSESFLEGLDQDFSLYHARAVHQTPRDLDLLLRAARSDEAIARMLVKPYAGFVLWWPYLRSTMPFLGNDEAGREAVVRVVLLVDKLYGYEPTVEEARVQTRRVLDKVFDPLEMTWKMPTAEELTKEGAPLAWAAPVVTFLSGKLTPMALLRVSRRMPIELAATGAVLVAAIVATIPIVTGWNLAARAEESATDALVHPHANTIVDTTHTESAGPGSAGSSTGSSAR